MAGPPLEHYERPQAAVLISPHGESTIGRGGPHVRSCELCSLIETRFDVTSTQLLVLANNSRFPRNR